MHILDQQRLQVSQATSENLRTVANSLAISDLSHLSLPEIDRVIDAVAKVVPAGNVPGIILNGLARMPERRPALHIVRRDIDLLFQATADFMDRAVFSAFFAGPAAVLWGYQNLLCLAGKDPNESFPEGTWQFYIDYALRDDTARHTNETHGFDSALNYHHIPLSRVDRISAWVMAAIQCLLQYPALLENEWRERVYSRLLVEETQAWEGGGSCQRLYREWEGIRPYSRTSAAHPKQTFSQFRHSTFDQFLKATADILPEHVRSRWQARIQQAEACDLPAYQKQMSIAAYLDPGPYGEIRTPLALNQLCVGIIDRDVYYLIPVWDENKNTPTGLQTIRDTIAALVSGAPPLPPVPLTTLARVKRRALPELKKGWSPKLSAEMQALNRAPIWINTSPMHGLPPGADNAPENIPLAVLRQQERGIGNHALTIFDYGQTFVFDQSHIFFDGAWGSALAEIITNEALSWAVLLARLPHPQGNAAAPTPLTFSMDRKSWAAIIRAPKAASEVSVESSGVHLRAVLSLRKLFKQRSASIGLTVNDLMVLYRAIHAFTYTPDRELVEDLHALKSPGNAGAAQAALEAVQPANLINPSLIIPVDASQIEPGQRLYPLNIEVPLSELGILEYHARTVAALSAYRSKLGDRTQEYSAFDQYQREYLACLAGLGMVMSKAKEIALRGESASEAAVHMLAHLPPALQRMLEAVPGRFDLLNDLIKGREVFSNVGQVTASSTLKRFITAKDDNEKKTLAWGVMTDARGTLRISLRDFRPHVDLLQKAGRIEFAVRIAEDYLKTYVTGFNRYIQDLHKITLTSRETKLAVKELQNDS